jgi:hypothetical protein
VRGGLTAEVPIIRAVIVVTGPGRSGTSLIAQLYRELGFDPGGSWDPRSRGGFEDLEVVRANIAILEAMGARRSARRFGLLTHLGVAEPMRQAARKLPQGLRVRARSLVKEPPGASGRRLDLLDWDRLPDVLSGQGARLRELAAARRVVKDPRFSWTLGVWAAAGVGVEHVLVCVRSLEAVVRSRVEAGWLERRSEVGARNWFAYGLGLCLSACQDHRLEHSVVRFPDFLEEPEALFGALRFPEPVSREDFLRVFSGLVRPELVRDRR